MRSDLRITPPASRTRREARTDSFQGRLRILRAPQCDSWGKSAGSSQAHAGSSELAAHNSRTLSAFSSRGSSAFCGQQGLFPGASTQVAAL
eukprot:2774154-Amphidinium_carterae.1